MKPWIPLDSLSMVN